MNIDNLLVFFRNLLVAADRRSDNFSETGLQNLINQHEELIEVLVTLNLRFENPEIAETAMAAIEGKNSIFTVWTKKKDCDNIFAQMIQPAGLKDNAIVELEGVWKTSGIAALIEQFLYPEKQWIELRSERDALEQQASSLRASGHNCEVDTELPKADQKAILKQAEKDHKAKIASFESASADIKKKILSLERQFQTNLRTIARFIECLGVSGVLKFEDYLSTFEKLVGQMGLSIIKKALSEDTTRLFTHSNRLTNPVNQGFLILDSDPQWDRLMPDVDMDALYPNLGRFDVAINAANAFLIGLFTQVFILDSKKTSFLALCKSAEYAQRIAAVFGEIGTSSCLPGDKDKFILIPDNQGGYQGLCPVHPVNRIAAMHEAVKSVVEAMGAKISEKAVAHAKLKTDEDKKPSLEKKYESIGFSGRNFKFEKPQNISNRMREMGGNMPQPLFTLPWKGNGKPIIDIVFDDKVLLRELPKRVSFHLRQAIRSNLAKLAIGLTAKENKHQASMSPAAKQMLISHGLDLGENFRSCFEIEYAPVNIRERLDYLLGYKTKAYDLFIDVIKTTMISSHHDFSDAEIKLVIDGFKRSFYFGQTGGSIYQIKTSGKSPVENGPDSSLYLQLDLEADNVNLGCEGISVGMPSPTAIFGLVSFVMKDSGFQVDRWLPVFKTVETDEIRPSFRCGYEYELFSDSNGAQAFPKGAGSIRGNRFFAGAANSGRVDDSKTTQRSFYTDYRGHVKMSIIIKMCRGDVIENKDLAPILERLAGANLAGGAICKPKVRLIEESAIPAGYVMNVEQGIEHPIKRAYQSVAKSYRHGRYHEVMGADRQEPIGIFPLGYRAKGPLVTNQVYLGEDINFRWAETIYGAVSLMHSKADVLPWFYADIADGYLDLNTRNH